jgi:hypothetical protein
MHAQNYFQHHDPTTARAQREPGIPETHLNVHQPAVLWHNIDHQVKGAPQSQQYRWKAKDGAVGLGQQGPQAALAPLGHPAYASGDSR